MASLIAQTKSGTSTLASTVITWNNNTVSGNTIVVAVATNVTTDVSTITDSQGNTYVNAFIGVGTGIGCELWYAKNILGGATPTVTVNYTSGATAAVVIQEYSGLDTTTILDRTATSSGNSSALDSTNTTLTNQPLELLIGVGGLLSGTFTAGGSFVNLTQQANSTVNVAIEDLFVTSKGAYNATLTGSGSNFWACGIASFRLAPQGTTTSVSSTSSTSSSISSTSSSTSSTSTSASSTSFSTSSTSSSVSTSSTSSSISSTSSSTSSTSTSSTSSSTSISSTSVSISSTSSSSTSTSSTSSSISISSTSSSFSSTSSSVSSTSASTSSTSFSSTSSSSSTSTTTVLGLTYSYIDDLSTYTVGTQIQTATGTRVSANTISKAYASNNTAGSLLVAHVFVSTTVNVVSSVTDTAGNIWARAGGIFSNSNTAAPRVEMWYAVNAKGRANIVTATESAAGVNAKQMIIQEFGGIVDNLALDRVATGSGLSASDSTNTTTPTTQANELVIACHGDAGNGTSVTVGAGYSNLVTDNSAIPTVAVENKRVTTIGKQVATFGMDNSFSWGSVIATFKATTLNSLTNPQIAQVGGDDGDYQIVYGSEYIIQEYKRKNTNSTDNPSFTWKGRSTMDTRISPLLIQILNVNTSTWETLAVANKIPPDVDFSITVTKSATPSNYYDTTNTVTFRSYQQVI